MAKAKQEKVSQDIRERMGLGDRAMTPEELLSATEVYMAQRLQECGNCEAVAVEEESTTEERITGKEFKIAKKALLEILSDSNCSPSLRLKAAENLDALIAIYERANWLLL